MGIEQGRVVGASRWLTAFAAGLLPLSAADAAEPEAKPASSQETPGEPEGAYGAVEAATELPPEVERLVRFYAGALSANKPFGGSLEATFTADSNINRATRAGALGPASGDLTLDDHTISVTAPGTPIGVTPPPQPGGRRSGTGMLLQGQTYWRAPVNNATDLLVRASGAGAFYGTRGYDDWVLSLQAGPEIAEGTDRIAFAVGPAWRWYGGAPYSRAMGGTVSWLHPTGRYTQLRIEGGYARVENLRNDLQDADTFSLAASVDRYFDARGGGGLQVFVDREAARDRGYATVNAGASAYAFRTVGPASLVATVGYSHLEADRQLAFFPRRRVEDRFTASLAATFRTLRLGPVAPLARVTWERNLSSVQLYDFRRVAGEIGLAASF